MAEELPASPCVRLCCLDDRDICLGCFRSLPEIMGWSGADADVRKRILEHCSERRAVHEQDLARRGK